MLAHTVPEPAPEWPAVSAPSADSPQPVASATSWRPAAYPMPVTDLTGYLDRTVDRIIEQTRDGAR